MYLVDVLATVAIGQLKNGRHYGSIIAGSGFFTSGVVSSAVIYGRVGITIAAASSKARNQHDYSQQQNQQLCDCFHRYPPN
jgi:hypothetical protein